jgi:divalent metal cation (Fe/Co/Zn/Cd) transporter
MHGIIRSDAITSVAAFIGISIALILETVMSQQILGRSFASGFILYNGYLIFRPALGEIMDEHLNDDLIAEIEGILSCGRIIDTESVLSVRQE